ncbi:DUF2989 domain-containing protein [Moritella marina ATCC 15381]|uniref:DUF2989 domain-containing protein n=1 Tax=Moritella marina ATCC 15381 TaxID=1202962 RepID=A0A5J6WIL7_MORMI|nr:DUF2989 domain-containing protein [Moritella marina]QFI36635.1 DUF2989 domain-containing protein [Moritella marina ATCC 15381]
MHGIRFIHRLISTVAVTSLLIACDAPDNVATICGNDKTMCADLNTDEWCQAERNELITQRFTVKENTNDQAQYRLLTALNDFQECIKIAALIEPRTHPELKTQRVAAMLSTYDELLALENKTLTSNNPYILNYHWVAHNNEQSKQRFIALSKQQHFDDPALYFAIANIYDNKNDKAIANLLKGISLISEHSSDMTTKLLYAIITAYMHKRDYALAYLWSQVAMHSDVENINLGLFNKHKITPSERRRLDVLAVTVAEQIAEQEFTTDRYTQMRSVAGL